MTYALLIFFIVLTVGVLVTGVIVMARGGSVDRKWSNKLMQARVWFQAISIGLVLLIFYFSQKH